MERGRDGAGVLGDVVHLAVGERHDGAQPRAVGLGQGLAQGGEQRRPVPAVAGEVDLAQLEAGGGGDLAADLVLRLGGLLRPVLEALAGRVVLDQQHDVVERLALLAAQDGVGEGGQQQGEEEDAPADAARAPPHAPGEGQDRDRRRGEEDDQRQVRGEDDAEGGHWPRRSSKAGTWTWSVL